MSYQITGAYPFQIDASSMEEMKRLRRRIENDHNGAIDGLPDHMLKISRSLEACAETGGQLFRDLANFWMLRYHLFMGDMDDFLSDKPGFRTLLHPDLTGCWRGTTLAFAGFKYWPSDDPVTITRSEGGVFFAEDGTNNSGCWRDRQLKPLNYYGIFRHGHMPGSIAEAEAWLQAHPPLDFEVYAARMRLLPRLMDRLFSLTAGYLRYFIPLDEYVNLYLDAAVPLYKRIALGWEAERYAENFQVEIEMVRAISKACDAHQRGEAGTHEKIVAAFLNYVGQETKIKRHFAI